MTATVGSTHERLWPALGGLVAGGVTITISELLAGVFIWRGWASGTPSPLLAVGGAFVDATPKWLKNAAVSAFGTHDKTALFVGMAITLVLVSAVIGLISARSRRVGLVALAALLVVAGIAIATRPDAAAPDLVPLGLGGLAGLLTLHASGSANWPGLVAPASSASTSSVDRRRALVIAGGTTIAAAFAAVAGRAISASERATQAARAAFTPPAVKNPVTIPAGAQLDVAGISPFVTPANRFYRIDTALTVPAVDPAKWQLTVTGMVDREVTLTWDDLLAQPMQQALVTLMCVSNEVGGGLTGNAIWTGWPVRDLLARAGVQNGADMVLSRSVDGFTAGTPLSALTDNRNALVAIAMNGQALPEEHGFPARLVVPGLYGYVSATKWVTELKVTTFAADEGYWTPRGWSALGPIKISSRIDVPSSNAKLTAGPVAVAGVAWHQHVGLSGVQVRVDDQPWRAARMAVDASIDAWRQWVFEWDAAPGPHTLTVRALDADGTPQTDAVAPPDPNGATGLHTITVTVT